MKVQISELQKKPRWPSLLETNKGHDDWSERRQQSQSHQLPKGFADTAGQAVGDREPREGMDDTEAKKRRGDVQLLVRWEPGGDIYGAEE